MRLQEAFARNLRSERLKRKFARADLAYKSEVSVSFISMLERGERSPTLATIEALAAALGVEPVRLFRS